MEPSRVLSATMEAIWTELFDDCGPDFDSCCELARNYCCTLDESNMHLFAFISQISVQVDMYNDSLEYSNSFSFATNQKLSVKFENAMVDFTKSLQDVLDEGKPFFLKNRLEEIIMLEIYETSVEVCSDWFDDDIINSFKEFGEDCLFECIAEATSELRIIGASCNLENEYLTDLNEYSTPLVDQNLFEIWKESGFDPKLKVVPPVLPKTELKKKPIRKGKSKSTAVRTTSSPTTSPIASKAAVLSKIKKPSSTAIKVTKKRPSTSAKAAAGSGVTLPPSSSGRFRKSPTILSP